MADIYDISAYSMGDVMNTDIGLMNMDKQITVPSFAYGPTNLISGVALRGPLASDKVEITSQKEKDQKVWNTIFLGAGILGAGLLVWKFRKTGVSKLWDGLKKLASTIKTKFKK